MGSISYAGPQDTGHWASRSTMPSLGSPYAFRGMAGLMATNSPRQVAWPTGT